MKHRIVTAALATTVLAAAPALAQTAEQPSDSGTQTQQKAGKKGKHPKRLSDAQLASVAEALGTTTAALKTAMAEVKRETAATEARESKAQKDALLAGKLGVGVEELRAAFASVRGRTDGTRGGARGERGERGGRGGCTGEAGTGTGEHPSGRPADTQS